MPENVANRSLANRLIGIPESRELDLLARMIETRGGRVVRCPLIAIRDSPDVDSIERWLFDVCTQELDTMIWMTGEGVRRIDGFAERLGYRDQLHTKLSYATTITRGPKPVRALRALGLTSNIAAPAPTTDGVIEALDTIDLGKQRVGLQLYGQEPNHKLQNAIRHRGAQPLPIAPYVYADDADEDQVNHFIEGLIQGDLDAVALTSATQVRRLFAVAQKHRRTELLTAALNSTCVAVVGPLVAESLQHAGVDPDLMPDNNFFMKPLVRSLVTYFEQSQPADR